MMKTRLTKAEQSQAFEYAREMYEKNPYARCFGGRGPAHKDQIINRIATGKMGEIAFAKLVRATTGHEVPVNLSKFVNTMDAEIKGHKVEILTTTHYNAHMLINLDKLEAAQSKGKLAELYVLIHVSSDESGAPTGNVTFRGFEELANLTVESEDVRYVEKGDVIPGTKIKMAMDNFVVKEGKLKDNWYAMMDIINKTAPATEAIANWTSPRASLAA